MSSAREQILNGIRRSLGRDGPLTDQQSAELQQRLLSPPRHPRPQLTGEQLDRFFACLTLSAASHVRVTSLDKVPAAVQHYLQQVEQDWELVVSDEHPLRDLTWPDGFTIHVRRAHDTDKVSLTSALCAVAETGTLLLTSSPHTPTTLNFLTEDHIVVLPVDRIVTHLEDAWQMFRRERNTMPRTVNLISGPSKTADVEQTLQVGAHGPRRLHVMVVG